MSILFLLFAALLVVTHRLWLYKGLMQLFKKKKKKAERVVEYPKKS